MSRRLVKLVLSLLVLVCGTTFAESLAERIWMRVSTDNFHLHSVLDEERTLELLRTLEVMRSAFSDPDAAQTFQAGVPTIIVALDKEDDYRMLGVPASTVGIFIADARENAIVIQDNERVTAVRTILHEYVHYLLRQNGRVVYPKWYEEGNAEYLSSSRIHNGEFEYGLPLQGRIATLNFAAWMPLADILAVDDTNELESAAGDLFYAQAWLLVHYLNSLPDAEQHWDRRLQDYNQLLLEGLDPVAAFEAAFELSVETLEDTLLKYFLAERFASRRIPVDTSLPNFAPRITELRQAQIEIVLARMAMRFHQESVAEDWFRSALADEETRPSAEAGLGTIYGRRGDIDQAEAHFEAAIYLVSYDFRMWMDYAQFWAERLYSAADREESALYAKRLEEALRNALTISDATPELNTLMGLAFLAQGKDVGEAITFLQEAVQQSPIDQGSRLLLASAYLHDYQPRRAIEIAESVLSFEHESNAATASAHELIDLAEAMLREQN
tara:strand:+ start:41902 stop:43398 length:1497 start_codon:yes stop_codon:yes gene_type:complete